MVAFGAVPASDSCPARGLARVGAVAGERTSPVRMIRTALEACTAPRLSPNVSLAGVPRLIPKLHRPWPGGGLPVRANSSLVQRNAETTTRAPQRQAVTMWTRPADRAPSYGPCGQGMDKCAALAHPLPTLGALAPTSPPLLQQRFMEKATAPAPAGSRITPSSQEIRLRNTPTNSCGDPTRECEKQHKGPAGYQEAGCATLSFYDAEGERLDTLSMGRMAEAARPSVVRARRSLTIGPRQSPTQTHRLGRVCAQLP